MPTYPFQTQFDPSQVFGVSPSGAEYSTIKSAVAAAGNVATSSNRALVEVNPGEYPEENPITIPPYVSLSCPGGFESTIMTCNQSGAGQDGFILTTNNIINGIQVIGASGPGSAGFHFGAASEECHVVSTKVEDCDIGWLSEAAPNDSPGIKVHGATVYSGTCTSAWKVSGGGSMNVESCLILNSATITNVFHVDGAGSVMRCANTRVDGTLTTRGIFLENDGEISIYSSYFNGCTTGLQIASSDGTAESAGCVFASTTNDIILANSAGNICGLRGCSADSSTFSIGAAAVFDGSFTDINVVQSGLSSIGEHWLGVTTSERVPLGAYSRGTFKTGWASGGEASLPGGLFVDIAAGSGFINTGTGVINVTWEASTIAVSADSNFFISVNSSGVIVSAASIASAETNILLAAGITDGTQAKFVSTDLIPVDHDNKRIDEWITNNIGLLWQSGLDVTNPAGLEVDIGSGVYSSPNESVSISGGSDVTLLKWYRDGSGGWNFASGQDVDDGFYDDNSGTLQGTWPNAWKKDTVYVSIDGSGAETYHYIYAQETYASSAEAIAASLPVPSSLFEIGDLAISLAGTVINKAAGSIGTITDERPSIAVAGPGAGVAAADHGALTGLGDDDHTGYARLSGNAARNPITGVFDISGGGIIIPTSASPAQIIEGSVVWDSDDDLLTVGDGSSRKTLIDTVSAQTLAAKTIEKPLIPDWIDFTPGAEPAHSEGRVFYDSTDKTLGVHVSDGSTIQIGQEQYIRVYNNDVVAGIANGQAVYVNGANSNRPTVDLADASAELTSVGTIGIATQSIAQFAQGSVTINGLVRDIDTTGGAETWVAGDTLYLSDTTPGGLTNVTPVSPNHIVRIGWVLNAHATLGIILVDVNDGEKVSSLRDVLITTIADDNILQWEASSSLWKNVVPAGLDTSAVHSGDAAGGDLAGTYPNPTVVASSESTAGKIEIATQAEVTTGTDDTRAVTPLKLSSALSSAGNPDSHIIQTTTLHTLSAVTPTTITSMSYTPPAGTWDVMFEAEVEGNGTLVLTFQAYSDATPVDGIRRRSFQNGRYDSLATRTRVTTTGSELITIKGFVSASSVSIRGRSLVLLSVTSI